MSSAADTGIIIGVGHSERQDDGVGPHIARELGRLGLPAVEHAGDGAGLLDLWDAKRACVVIDAMADAGSPGSVRVFADPADPGFARASFVHSSHRIGVPEAVVLGRALDRLPPRLVVIGICGATFAFGHGLSPPVAAAADTVIERLSTADDPFGDAALADLATV